MSEVLKTYEKNKKEFEKEIRADERKRIARRFEQMADEWKDKSIIGASVVRTLLSLAEQLRKQK